MKPSELDVVQLRRSDNSVSKYRFSTNDFLVLNEDGTIRTFSNQKEGRLIGKMNSTEIKCPCCGQDYAGEYDICSVCNWENDPIQLKKPDLRGGANKMSLTEAREAYSKGEKVL